MTVEAEPVALPPRASPLNLGLFVIALKLLVNDRSKFYSVVIGITFAVFLMTIMTSMFAGILQRSSATVANVGASIWVMDPAVQKRADPRSQTSRRKHHGRPSFPGAARQDGRLLAGVELSVDRPDLPSG